jgi:hypothetical protein
MFKLTSDLSVVQRRELPIVITAAAATPNNEVYASGYSGSWVTLDSAGNAILASTGAQIAWPVWNESYRTGAQGWSPDVAKSKSVTVFVGKVTGLTDRFDSSTNGTITLGAPLTISTAAGKRGYLMLATVGTHDVKAFCRKASHSITHLGTTFTVIEIETV